MSSILTNNGAMVALQTLKSVNDDLGKTQTSISTGKEVGTAKDNSAVWAISKTMESDIAGFEAIEEGLSIGEATVAVASAGAEQIVEKLTEMKELIVSAQSETLTTRRSRQISPPKWSRSHPLSMLLNSTVQTC